LHFAAIKTANQLGHILSEPVLDFSRADLKSP